MYKFAVGLLMRVSYTKRSYNTLSNFLSDFNYYMVLTNLESNSNLFGYFLGKCKYAETGRSNYMSHEVDNNNIWIQSLNFIRDLKFIPLILVCLVICARYSSPVFVLNL